MDIENIKNKTVKFWNNKKTVDIFHSQPISEYWLDFFKSYYKMNSNKKVLDLGCGGGRNTKMLLDLGYDVSACDLHDEMVEITRKEYAKHALGKNLKKVVMSSSMTKLPYEDESFDVILSHGVYHNAVSVNEFLKALRESARVLKKNGYLCFNIFSSALVENDLKKVGGDLYLTKEGLLMVLLSGERFLKEAEKIGLMLERQIVEYVSHVSTGGRSVMRGVLRKLN